MGKGLHKLLKKKNREKKVKKAKNQPGENRSEKTIAKLGMSMAHVPAARDSMRDSILKNLEKDFTQYARKINEEKGEVTIDDVLNELDKHPSFIKLCDTVDVDEEMRIVIAKEAISRV